MTIRRMRLVSKRNRTRTTIKTKRMVYINRKRVENHEYSIEFNHHRRTSDGSRTTGKYGGEGIKEKITIRH